ncbi:MAG TPA: hypothetical protein HA362_01400 [Nanoarchaeota archaeon]|nr:hypothetical protein [Nanoarchaeota archaeon]
MLKGCGCYEEETKIIPDYEMRLLFEFYEFRKSLKKNRRKHPYKYLIRKDKTETKGILEKLETEILLFPKQVQKRIKSIIANVDKLTVFQEEALHLYKIRF